jgi:hypothetical protein
MRPMHASDLPIGCCDLTLIPLSNGTTVMPPYNASGGPRSIMFLGTRGADMEADNYRYEGRVDERQVFIKKDVFGHHCRFANCGFRSKEEQQECQDQSLDWQDRQGIFVVHGQGYFWQPPRQPRVTSARIKQSSRISAGRSWVQWNLVNFPLTPTALRV